VPRYELTHVHRLFNAGAPELSANLRVNPDDPSELLFEPGAQLVGELRQFSADGTEAIGIQPLEESNHVDLWATNLVTGAVRRVTRTEYIDPVGVSPDDEWIISLDVHQSGRSRWLAELDGATTY
jgi:hypothetical protein